MLSVNSALEGGDPDKTLEALLDEHLDLAGVYQENNDYYQEGLLHKKREKEEVSVCLYAFFSHDVCWHLTLKG